MKYVFDELFPESYTSLEYVVKRFVKDKSVVLDVGSGDGKVAQIIDKHKSGCRIYCLDPNENVFIPALQHNTSHNIHGTYQDFLERKVLTNANPEITIFHRSLHHVSSDVFHYYPPSYIHGFESETEKKHGRRQIGLFIIGEVFYPRGVSEEDFEKEMLVLQEKTNHRHKRDDYMPPDSLVKLALRSSSLEFFDCHWETPIKKFYQLVVRK